MESESKSSRATRREVLQLGMSTLVAGMLPHHAIAAEALRTRTIPSSGEPLPVIGLGTYGVFDVGESESQRAACQEVLAALLSAGASVVDSSPMYGRAERVSGDLAANLDATNKVFWATKVWTDGRESGIDQMTRSMRLFRTDRIDLMQVHNLRDWKAHMRTLRDWKEQGRIRYIGITHYRVEAFDELENIIRETELDFVQLNYSIGERAAEERLLPLCADKGIATLINRPYQRGALFSKVEAKVLPEWAREFSAQTWGQFFLKFILANEAVTCVIPATRKKNHMLDNLAAGMGNLPEPSHVRAMVEYMSGL
jgi:diketogulonate reductase-like aldo/keto reductase